MKVCIRVVRDKSGGYTAMCPSLPGCVSHGKTREEAAERLVESIRGYIAALSNFVPERLDYEIVQT
jgi:predicted RNase H-like HicB family nuclease